jgi:glycosyltransferase involved in cell wall biosynthesis
MKKVIKVLHTEWSDGWGGQEIRIINEMIAVREKGVDVFLACRDHSIIKQKAEKFNIKVFNLPFKGNLDFRTVFELKKIIKENNISIVNTHSGKDTWVGGLAAKFSGIKFIRSRHLSNHISSSRLNFINELADYIFTTGENIRENMIKYNRIDPNKIKSIPTGVDADIYDSNKYDRKYCRNKFNLVDGQIVIGMVAILRYSKRHDMLLETIANMAENIHVLIAGDGPQMERIVSMVNDMNLNEKVTILGHVKNVPELLEAIDIFVLTSDSEGVPQSIMQALLMNKTVVATNVGGTKDLYNKKNFILIRKGDKSALKDTLIQLINDKDLRGSYEKKSRSYILENFSKKIMTRKILDIYQDITQ